MSSAIQTISGLILAGGEGKRVGGVDKGLIEYQGRALIEHVIDTIRPAVDDLVISANRNIEHYQRYTDKVISDQTEQYLGPLAGIHAAMPHCAHEWILLTPCDTPLLPNDLVARLLARPVDRPIIVAETEHMLQPVMLLHRSLHHSIEQALDKDERRLMSWVRTHEPQTIVFPDGGAFNSFNKSTDFLR
jgi:molybdenum cofactor guanylyltransferase